MCRRDRRSSIIQWLAGKAALSTAKDDERASQSIAEDGDEEYHNASEAESGPVQQATQAYQRRTRKLAAPEQLLGALAAGEFLGCAEGRESAGDLLWGATAGGFVEDMGANFLHDVGGILLHEFAQLFAQGRKIGIDGSFGFRGRSWILLPQFFFQGCEKARHTGGELGPDASHFQSALAPRRGESVILARMSRIGLDPLGGD